MTHCAAQEGDRQRTATIAASLPAKEARPMKLQTLKSGLRAAPSSRLQVLSARPLTVDRKRGSAGVKDRAKIKQRDCGLCQECKRCGCVTIGDVVDHIIPLWNGGSDEDDNKELLCNPCHDAKTAAEAGQRTAY
jgi:5-methylcytosine-specific restriction endonuclease McrA